MGRPKIGISADDVPDETLALGIRDDQGEVHACVYFNGFYDDHAALHLASNGRKRWLTRRVIRTVFAYAFHHLGLKRLEMRVAADNIPVQVLALKLGLRIEGVARCGAVGGKDGIMFAMLAHECPWVTDLMQGDR